MKRWRAKNPKPLQHERPQQTQNKPRDRKPAPKRGERVATVARAEKDAEWICFVLRYSNGIWRIERLYPRHGRSCISGKYTGETWGREVHWARQISGIASSVMATKSRTHKLFGECLFAPESRLSLISHQMLADRFSIFYDSLATYLPLLRRTQAQTSPPWCLHPALIGYTACGTTWLWPSVHPSGISLQGILANPERRTTRGVLKLHAGLNHPSDEALTRLLDNGGIIGCPWTSRDLRLSRNIFGECVKCRVGKTTNPSAPPSQSPSTNSPGELFHADIFFVMTVRGVKVPYLLSLDDTVNYMMVVKVKSRRADALFDAFTKMINAYKSYG